MCYYASLLPYALQPQMAPFQTLLTWALLVRSSSRAWVAFELALKSEKLKNYFSNLGVLNGGRDSDGNYDTLKGVLYPSSDEITLK